jgi:hypothetical protein
VVLAFHARHDDVTARRRGIRLPQRHSVEHIVSDAGGDVLLGDRPVADLPQPPYLALSGPEDAAHHCLRAESRVDEPHHMRNCGRAVALSQVRHEDITVAVADRRPPAGH